MLYEDPPFLERYSRSCELSRRRYVDIKTNTN